MGCVPKEIDRLLVPPGKAYMLLTDHLITGQLLKSEPAQEKWFQVKPSIYISLSGLLGYLYLKHFFKVMTTFFWLQVQLNGGNIPT